MRVVFNLADRITVLDRGQAAGRGHAAGDRRQRRRCRPPIWEGANERARSRGAQHVLRQEPHPARRGLTVREGEIATLLGRNGAGKTTTLAQPRRPDAAAHRHGAHVRRETTRMPALPRRGAGRRLRPRGATHLRQPDGGRQSARAAGAAGAVDHRARSTGCSRASPSASATSAASSPAASRRCCRSRARCCSTRSC